MIERKKILFALWIVFNFLLIFSIILYETGYTLEGYLPAHGEKALKYAPILYSQPNDKPQLILYSFDRSGGVWYYVIWEREKAGIPIIDQFYDYIRRLFYGSAIDVEGIVVYPKNRTITFETYGHERIRAKFDSSNCYYDRVTIINCVENETHVKVYVATWNHLFTLIPQNGTVKANVKMKPMSPTDYIRYSIFRRMNEGIKEAVIKDLAIASIVTVLLNTLIYRFVVRRKY
ncbi:hypothetical protein E3E31_11455 [Thermococcus sp. M39]|uniref:hypothetical protein n=1 Tax=unclassified Thermococcus TaxID=2627626 RepID=UPI001438CCD3|nr:MULTISPECIES: hypothetical protein [unclassified Thermococcus]NJE09129.1 hypothetical protein [Thermococcus sp. M39]NJE12078.1 hypothetical protein [Thermococcus sp. LS2]